MYVTLKRPSLNRSIVQASLIALMIVLAIPGDSLAQKIRERKVSGSITAVANGLLKVKNKHGEKEEWIVKPQGVSNFLATAPKEWLQPGVVVMVTSTFDDQGTASYPVAMLQAFTPRPGRVLGVVADPSIAGDPADKSAPKGYLLAGPIKSIEDGALKIAVGRKSFTVPMAEEVEVSVDLINDLSWVKVGDEIECKVKYVQVGQGIGAEMKVTAKETLAPRPKAPPSKKERLAKARREKAEAKRAGSDAANATADSSVVEPAESE